jgi:hypothetical protein
MDAIVMLCHRLDDATRREFENLRSAASPLADVTLLCQSDLPPEAPACQVTREHLLGLGYPGLKVPLRAGQFYFSLMAFHQAHRQRGYRHYWFVEYDVRFTGNWRDFFEQWSPSEMDLLTTHIRVNLQEPAWYWWGLEHPTKSISVASRLRCFYPIFRISRPALEYLHQCLVDGWAGHGEVLVPTLLFHGGFALEDFGGTGPFVRAENREKFYLDSPTNAYGELREGTFRWRPSMREPGPEPGKLYHPIKTDSQ